jgi:hypothetical protein
MPQIPLSQADIARDRSDKLDAAGVALLTRSSLLCAQFLTKQVLHWLTSVCCAHTAGQRRERESSSSGAAQ